MKIILVLLLCAAACGAPVGSEVNEIVPEEISHQEEALPLEFIMEAGPYVPPPEGWQGADACARRTEDRVAKKYVKLHKIMKAKKCEVKVKGKKWNKIKGQCRAALRFCALYKKFAKIYASPQLLFTANGHCKKAEKHHKKMFKSAIKYWKLHHKAVKIVDAKCMMNKRCRRKHFRRMRKAQRNDPPVKVHNWRAFVAKHKHCMKNKKCRAKYLRRRALSFRTGTRAARRCEYKRCMKNNHCRRRYLIWKRHHSIRKARRGRNMSTGLRKPKLSAAAKKAVKKSLKKHPVKKKASKKLKKPKLEPTAGLQLGWRLAMRRAGIRKASQKIAKPVPADVVITNMFNF